MSSVPTKAVGSSEASRGVGSPSPRALLLSGVPGIGKTTVIRRVAETFDAERLGGFYTAEIREAGQRKGFRLVGFEGTERVIAHVAFAKGPRVGRYGVDVAAVDEAARLLAPDPAVRLYLVDEIGRMECLSSRFVAAMRRLLEGRTPVVATVALHGTGFIAEVKRMNRCVLWQVTQANRDQLPSWIAAWVTERGPFGRRGGGSAKC